MSEFRHEYIETEGKTGEVKRDAIAHNIYADFQNFCIEELNGLNKRMKVDSLYDAQEKLSKEGFEEYKAVYDALRDVNFYANEKRLGLQEKILQAESDKEDIDK